MKVTIKRFAVGIDGYMIPDGQNYIRDLALKEVAHHIYFVEKDQEYEVTSEESSDTTDAIRSGWLTY